MSEVHSGRTLERTRGAVNFMGLNSEDFASIATHVELEVGRLIGRRRDPFFSAIVTKRDTDNNLIWIKEIPDQPIPLVGFDYEITYYDESPRGTGGGGSFKTYKKTAKAKLMVPKVGEVVLIVREMSYDGHPRCLGVIQSTNFIQDLEDD
jgi:hypothetical protein